MEKRNALPKSKAPPPPESSEEETASSEEETEDDEQGNEGSGLDSGSAESADVASKKKPAAVVNPKQQSTAKAASAVKAAKAVKAAATSKAPSTAVKAANTTAAAAKAATPTAAAAKAAISTPATAKAANPTAADAKAASTAADAKAAGTAPDAKAASISAAAKGADTAVAPISGKRLRETNGKKEKLKGGEEEPLKKRKKTEVATPAPKVAPKVVEQSEKKVSSRAAKGKSIAPAKEKKQDVEEETKKPSSKRKAKSPGAADVDMLRAEDEASQKPKITARPWTPEEEMALSKEVQKDRINGVYGSSLPSAKSDPYWENLVGRCPFMLQYEEDLRIERLREKVRRMRLRYEDLDKRHKAGDPNVYRKPHEKDLWPIWKAIWGPSKVDEEEEDEEGEEDESEDNGSDEDEEKEAPEKERPPSENSKDVQKKKVAGGSSTDEDEGSPVVPNVTENVVPTVSDAVTTFTDDLRAENLALLRDMKSTCLKMVDEARTQSLFIAEKILGDTRVKTIEILDEGREKSLLIMEQMRILAERVNAASLGLAAQGGFPWASSSSGDPSRKEISLKWGSFKEAEGMLHLQKLQLVQDEARLYQEAIVRRLRPPQPDQPAQQD